ncbi:MAG: site-specific integrase [Oscillospiraceae bacterium]|jgi:integrase|nr:site-specific integrase [Oscillospiraceae bacterium]
MSRKGENIYKRKDGRWEGRYIKGKKPDGKPRYGYVYSGTYGGTRQKLLPLKILHSKPENKRLYCGQFGDYLLSYLLELRAGGSIKPSTYGNYHRIVYLHIIPALGGKPMHKLSEQDIRNFLTLLKAKNLGGATIRGVFRLLSTVVSKAVSHGAMENNICAKITLPKTQKKKVSALSFEAQKALERAALGGKNGAAVILALYTGMRIGEICALRWEDVSLANGTVYVAQTLQRMQLYNGEKSRTSLHFGRPKTASSQRVIPLPECVIKYLKALKPADGSRFVITCMDGLAEPRVVQYRFQSLLKKAGIEHVNFHALRHTFATRCIELGMDITTLSQLLGHSSVKLTLDTYTDSVISHKKAAMRELDKLALFKQAS